MGAIRQEMRSLAKITSFCGSHEHYVLAMTSFIFQFALKSLIFSWCPKCKYSYSKLLFTFVAFSKISLHAACTSAIVFSCVTERVTSSKTDRYKSNQNNVFKVNMLPKYSIDPCSIFYRRMSRVRTLCSL